MDALPVGGIGKDLGHEIGAVDGGLFGRDTGGQNQHPNRGNLGLHQTFLPLSCFANPATLGREDMGHNPRGRIH